MARPEGLPKTGGRKKGTPNKKTVDLQDALASKGLNVTDKLAEIVPQLDVERQAAVLTSLLAYLYPKRKALEVTAQLDVDTPNPHFVEPSEQEKIERYNRIVQDTQMLMQVDTEFARTVLASLDRYYLQELGYQRATSLQGQ